MKYPFKYLFLCGFQQKIVPNYFANGFGVWPLFNRPKP